MHVNSSFAPANSHSLAPWLNQFAQAQPEKAKGRDSEEGRKLPEKSVTAEQHGAAHTVSESQLWASSLTQTQFITLQVRTREGDLVNVEIGGKNSSSQTQFQSSSDGSQVYASASESSSESSFSLSVQGDLSAEELDSISKLVDKVGSLADKFFDGDAHAAVAHASKLGLDTSTLSAFSLNMSQTETKTEVRAYQRVSTYADAPASSQAVPASLAEPVSDFLTSVKSMLDQISQSGLFDDPKMMLKDMLAGLANLDPNMREKAAIIENSAQKPFAAVVEDLVSAASVA